MSLDTYLSGVEDLPHAGGSYPMNEDMDPVKSSEASRSTTSLMDQLLSESEDESNNDDEDLEDSEDNDDSSNEGEDDNDGRSVNILMYKM